MRAAVVTTVPTCNTTCRFLREHLQTSRSNITSRVASCRIRHWSRSCSSRISLLRPKRLQSRAHFLTAKELLRSNSIPSQIQFITFNAAAISLLGKPSCRTLPELERQPSGLIILQLHLGVLENFIESFGCLDCLDPWFVRAWPCLKNRPPIFPAVTVKRDCETICRASKARDVC